VRRAAEAVQGLAERQHERRRIVAALADDGDELFVLAQRRARARDSDSFCASSGVSAMSSLSVSKKPSCRYAA
jgi:hypothetical protein